MDQGAWWATVHEVRKSQTRLSKYKTTAKDKLDKTFLWEYYQLLFLLLKHNLKERSNFYVNFKQWKSKADIAEMSKLTEG